MFPHGRNLNLLILTVVGASATASLLVGGLIFFLAKRSRAARKISKLQLSDDVEDRGKLQEEYKVNFCLKAVFFKGKTTTFAQSPISPNHSHTHSSSQVLADFLPTCSVQAV